MNATLNATLADLETIGLDELNERAAMLTRVDRKYALDAATASSIVRRLNKILSGRYGERARGRDLPAAHGTCDGIVYNPGAHTHYSYALRDALGSVSTPCVEVHISDVSTREAFRHISVIAPACVAQVKGRGFKGYCDAIDILLEGPRERLGEGFEERYPTGEVIAAPLK